MNGKQIRDYRERHEITQADLAEILNGAFGRKYHDATIGRWENGKRGIPKDVAAFMDSLALNGSGLADDYQPPAAGPGDSPPPAPVDAPQVPFSATGIYTRACTELFEMVGTATSLIGTVLGSEKLLVDGQIIDGDKDALGAAWGKLAETNETFRRLLVQATTGGAWIEVGFVTGITANKILQNHLPPVAASGEPAEPSEPHLAPDGSAPVAA